MIDPSDHAILTPRPPTTRLGLDQRVGLYLRVTTGERVPQRVPLVSGGRPFVVGLGPGHSAPPKSFYSVHPVRTKLSPDPYPLCHWKLPKIFVSVLRHGSYLPRRHVVSTSTEVTSPVSGQSRQVPRQCAPPVSAGVREEDGGVDVSVRVRTCSQSRLRAIPRLKSFTY